MPYLVYVKGARGPEPQIWRELDYGIGDWKRDSVIRSRPIHEDEVKEGIDALAKKYFRETAAAN